MVIAIQICYFLDILGIIFILSIWLLVTFSHKTLYFRIIGILSIYKSHFPFFFFLLFLFSCPLWTEMEKAMATHSSILAWKIPWTGEPGRLQSMGSLGVGHDWVTSLSLFTFMCWRTKWQPTPVFLPGGSQGWGSLVGCRLWGRTESDTTEAT